MRLSDALADVTQLYIETAPFIYFVEQVPVYIERIRAIMCRVNAGNCEGYTSVITLAEVLPIRLKKNELEQRYREILSNSAHFTLVEIDAEIAFRAAYLLDELELDPPTAA